MALQYDVSKLREMAERMYMSAWIAEACAVVAGLAAVAISDVFLPDPKSLTEVVQHSDTLAAVVLIFGVFLLVGRAVGALIRGQAQIVLNQTIALGQTSDAKTLAAAE